jgi:hypothetical protein
MKQIEQDDFSIMPDNQLFTIGDLKVIHNVLIESGIQDGWLTGHFIMGKIEIMLNNKTNKNGK